MAQVTNKTNQTLLIIGERADYTIIPSGESREVDDEIATRYAETRGGEALVKDNKVTVIFGDGPGEVTPVDPDHADFLKLRAVDAKTLIAEMADPDSLAELAALEGLHPTVEQALRARLTAIMES